MIYDKVLLGVSFAAPIGPVTAEALRRGLLGGFKPAFRVKMGAAIGDTIFLVVAYYGISAILQYTTLCSYLSLFGSVLLLYIGYKNILKSIYPQPNPQVLQDSLRGGMWLGMGIALTNPFALAWWLSVFASLLAEANYNSSFAGLMENMYIIVGILIWDVIFCTLLAGGKRIINGFFIKIITGGAGLALCYFGSKFGCAALSKLLLA